MKPHKSRLELAKEAAAQRRCADTWPLGCGMHSGGAVIHCLSLCGTPNLAPLLGRGAPSVLHGGVLSSLGGLCMAVGSAGFRCFSLQHPGLARQVACSQSGVAWHVSEHAADAADILPCKLRQLSHAWCMLEVDCATDVARRCPGVLASCKTLAPCKRTTAPAKAVSDPSAHCALYRDSDASKGSVRRMVGRAFAKAISTEGKSLGEVIPIRSHSCWRPLFRVQLWRQPVDTSDTTCTLGRVFLCQSSLKSLPPGMVLTSAHTSLLECPTLAEAWLCCSP